MIVKITQLRVGDTFLLPNGCKARLIFFNLTRAGRYTRKSYVALDYILDTGKEVRNVKFPKTQVFEVMQC